MKEGFQEGYNETISHRANRCNGVDDDDDCSDDEGLSNFEPLASVVKIIINSMFHIIPKCKVQKKMCIQIRML